MIARVGAEKSSLERFRESLPYLRGTKGFDALVEEIQWRVNQAAREMRDPKVIANERLHLAKSSKLAALDELLEEILPEPRSKT